VDLQESLGAAPGSRSSFLGTTGIVSQVEPYRSTDHMRIPHTTAHDGGRSNVNSAEVGVSLGVDVSHMAPPPRQVDAAMIDRANVGNTNDFGGAGGKAKGDGNRKMTGGTYNKKLEGGHKETAAEKTPETHSELGQTAAHPPPSITTSDQTNGGVPPYPSRPLLDEAISWDRIVGVGKENKKKGWWHMP
jgi:hypothetical protein